MTEENNTEHYIQYDTSFGIHSAKQLLYQKIETKLDLFEQCLDEVGLYKSYPFFDITHKLPFMKNIIPKSLQNYPIDNTEELLMRNCARRNIQKLKEIKSLLISNNK